MIVVMGQKVNTCMGENVRYDRVILKIYNLDTLNNELHLKSYKADFNFVKCLQYPEVMSSVFSECQTVVL